jgi:general secretion pathway protein J
MKSQAGFTLIELLLSMTLLSLLLVALFGGLRFMGRGGDRIDSVAAESEKLDLVRDVLTRQMAELFPLKGGDKLIFTGKPDRLAFAMARPQRGLTLAVFDIDDNRLYYREYAFLAGETLAVADNPTRSTLLLEGHGPLAFRYRDKNVWRDEWADPASLPQEVALDAAGWPELVARPEATP